MLQWLTIGHTISSIASALSVLTAMITPALLISACGTFLLSTSTRLARVIDRVRVLSQTIDDMVTAPKEIHLAAERRTMMLDQMNKLSRRATILSNTMMLFYLASATFVASSVSIALVSLFGQNHAWIPLLLAISGAMLLFWASMLLILEARLANSSLHAEMVFLSQLVRYESQMKARPDAG